MRKNKLIIVFSALAIVVAMVFSLCFVAAEVNHECVNEDCAVCLQINAVISALKLMGGTSAVANIFAAAVSLALFVRGFFSNYRHFKTLITMKVKLSD